MAVLRNESWREMAFGQQAAEQIHCAARGGIKCDFLNLFHRAALMRYEDTRDRPVGTNRDPVDDRVNRIAQILEAGNESDIQFARGQFPRERGRLSKFDRARPAVNQRTRVEILNATNAEDSPHAQASSGSAAAGTGRGACHLPAPR